MKTLKNLSFLFLLTVVLFACEEAVGPSDTNPRSSDPVDIEFGNLSDKIAGQFDEDGDQ